MIGLFVFFYATMHLLAYAWFDQGFIWSELVADVIKRPFILVGMLSWSMLLMLAATSFNRAIRWLGARRWQWLHRLVYVDRRPGGVALLLDAQRQKRLRRSRDLCADIWRLAGMASLEALNRRRAPNHRASEGHASTSLKDIAPATVGPYLPGSHRLTASPAGGAGCARWPTQQAGTTGPFVRKHSAATRRPSGPQPPRTCRPQAQAPRILCILIMIAL